MLVKLKCFLLLITVPYCCARIHTLETSHDGRQYIPLSTFGFNKGGILVVQLNNFTVSPDNKYNLFGFSMIKNFGDYIKPYLKMNSSSCLLQNTEDFSTAIYFTMDLNSLFIQATCSQSKKGQVIDVNESIREMKNVVSEGFCNKLSIPIEEEIRNGVRYYSTRFAISVLRDSEEGMYNLYFHGCPSYNGWNTYDFAVSISEQNVGGYLSAEEIPLPTLYYSMAGLFFVTGCFWVFLLRQSEHPISKIHYLMSALVFLKSLSLVFQGVNYHIIAILGTRIATWVILFYIAHSLESVLLFITLMFISTGWTLIEPILTPRDKCLLVVFIPLKVLAMVAEIILQKSNECLREYYTRNDLFIFSDLLCSFCIELLAICSMKRMQRASLTVDEAAALVSIKKLKLFRHLYVIVLSYIHCTRVVYLLKLIVPLQYGWIGVMISEMATYLFFVLTGYRFTPEEDLVLSDMRFQQLLSRVDLKWEPAPKTAVTLTEVTEEESNTQLSKTESGHESNGK